MTRVELPVLSFLAVLSLFVILPLHLRSRNIPFLFVIAWLLVCNIIQGVGAIVWANNTLIRAEGWCDLGEWFPGNRFSSVNACLIDFVIPSYTYPLRPASSVARRSVVRLPPTRNCILYLGRFVRPPQQILHVGVPLRNVSGDPYRICDST